MTWLRPDIKPERILNRLAHYESLGAYDSVDGILFGRTMGLEIVRDTGDSAMMAEVFDVIGRSVAARNYDLIFGRSHSVSFLKWDHPIVLDWLESNLPSDRRFQSRIEEWGVRGKPPVWDHPKVKEWLEDPKSQSLLTRQGIVSAPDLRAADPSGGDRGSCRDP